MAFMVNVGLGVVDLRRGLGWGWRTFDREEIHDVVGGWDSAGGRIQGRGWWEGAAVKVGEGTL